MNDFAHKPADLWPGGENAEDENAVRPIAYALTVCPPDTEPDTEPDTAEIRMVTMVLQEDPVIVVAELTAADGMIRADADRGGNPSTEMDRETAAAVFSHYAGRFNGKAITLSVDEDAGRNK